MFATAYLDRALHRNLIEIDAQIQRATESAHEHGVNVADLRYQDGTWVLNELLHAKATTLAAMVQLKSMKKAK